MDSSCMDKLNMAETATLRLMAAAKEFNIGKDTLVDFLVGKGFSKDDFETYFQTNGRNVPLFATGISGR